MKFLGPLVAVGVGLVGVASAAEKGYQIHFNDMYWFRGTDHPEPIQLNKCVKMPEGLTVQSARVESDNSVSCSGFQGPNCAPEGSALVLDKEPEVESALKSYKCE